MTGKLAVSKQHTIADIRYVRHVPAELAPITCRCGWHGRSGEFQRHRAEMGARSAKEATTHG